MELRARGIPGRTTRMERQILGRYAFSIVVRYRVKVARTGRIYIPKMISCCLVSLGIPGRMPLFVAGAGSFLYIVMYLHEDISRTFQWNYSSKASNGLCCSSSILMPA